MSGQPRFIIRFGHDASDWHEYPLEAEDVLIGRTSDCDLQLENAEVSRYHANLKVDSDGVSLMDMGSTNGTYINGEPLTPNQRIVIEPGTSFHIGPFALVLEAVAVPTPALEQTMVRPSTPKVPMYDLEELRRAEFPHITSGVYLNNAGAAPLPMRTRSKMLWATDQMLTYPTHFLGEGALEMYGTFQSVLAQFVNAASPNEIVVVDSLTDGVNAIAQSLMWYRGDNVVLCDLEFPSLVYPFMSLKTDGVIVREVPAMNGGLKLEALHEAVDDQTRVIAASSVQFFSGHRTDLAAIGAFCRERNIVFVVDAIQSIGHIPIDVRAMNIDVLITGGYKSLLAGPGVGFMVVRSEVSEAMRPRLASASSTHDPAVLLDYDVTPGEGASRFLMGTPNIPAMHGILESVELINELDRRAIDKHTSGLAMHAMKAAQAAGYELVTVPGEHGPIATFKTGHDSAQLDAVLQSLGEQKIIAGRHLDKQGVPHIRLSVHCYNTQEEVDRCFEMLRDNITTF